MGLKFKVRAQGKGFKIFKSEEERNAEVKKLERSDFVAHGPGERVWHEGEVVFETYLITSYQMSKIDGSCGC
jgi:hypothetical protein